MFITLYREIDDERLLNDFDRFGAPRSRNHYVICICMLRTYKNKAKTSVFEENSTKHRKNYIIDFIEFLIKRSLSEYKAKMKRI